MLKSVHRMLASLKLAVTLIVLLASVLAWATILEARYGREFAQWYVYGSPWFLGFLAALGINILAATTVRFPWKCSHTGFLVTHAGLLVLLVGAVQTFLLGVEGQISLQEGQQADQVLITNRSRITARRQSARGRVATEFTFHPGPVDWPERQQLDFGTSDDLGLKILRFYRHARERTDWVEDALNYDGAVLRLELRGPDDRPLNQEWLAANQFGGEAILGPTRYDLWPVPMASLVEEFLKPPVENLGETGVLSIHYEGRIQRVSVAEYLGQPVSLGDSGIVVEIAEYLPDAKPSAGGRFVSRSKQPKNPLLELKVKMPGEDPPRRQIACAKLPLLTLDAVHGRQNPVKFWYHHPQVNPAAGAAFVQAPDGTLYCRPASGGAYQEARTVRQGDRIPLGSEFSLLIQQHLPHARREVSFVPVELAPGEAAKGEAAALVELRALSQIHRVWLQRQDPQYGFQRIVTEQGPVELTFDYDQLPLGFRLQLEQFSRRLNPGHVGDAAFASTVRVTDPARNVHETREISMNEPLDYGRFTFYQSSFREQPGGADVSVLTAASDPGRFLKYLGSLMVCAGIAIMFYMRSYLFERVPGLPYGTSSQQGLPHAPSDHEPGDTAPLSVDNQGTSLH